KNYREENIMDFFQLLEAAGFEVLGQTEMEEWMNFEKIIEMSLQWFYNYTYKDVPAEIKKQVNWKAMMDEHKKWIDITYPEYIEDGNLGHKFSNLLIHNIGVFKDRMLHSLVRHVH
ncbi:hypothetical protein ACFLQK_01785, partial [bacterium]